MYQNQVTFIILSIICANIFSYLTEFVNVSEIIPHFIIGIILSLPYFGSVMKNNEKVLEFIADFGILSLMFLAGLESSIGNIEHKKKDILIIAFFTFVIPFITGFLFLKLLGYSNIECIICGLVLGITAEAVNSKILIENNYINSNVGLTIISVGIIDDIIGLLVLLFLLCSFNKNGIKKDIVITILLIVLFFVGLRIRKKYNTNKYKQNNLVQTKAFNIYKNISLCLIIPFFFIYMGYQMDISNQNISLMFIIILTLLAFASKILGMELTKNFIKYENNDYNIIKWGLTSRGAIGLALIMMALRNKMIDKKLFSSLIFMIIITTLTFIIISKKLIQNHKENFDIHELIT